MPLEPPVPNESLKDMRARHARNVTHLEEDHKKALQGVTEGKQREEIELKQSAEKAQLTIDQLNEVTQKIAQNM